MSLADILTGKPAATTSDRAKGNNDTLANSAPVYEGKHWFFTDWVDQFPADLGSSKNKGDRLFNILKEVGCKKIVFQTEVCPTTGKEHFQGMFSLIKKKKLSAILKQIFEGRKNQVRPALSIGGSVDYCTKEETRKSPDEVWYYPCKPYNQTTITTFKEWQKDIIKVIREPADDRTVFWFWSEAGKIGKSTFCKYLYDNYNGEGGNVVVFDSMKKSDVYFTFAGGKNPSIDYLPPKIVIFDLPRARLKSDDFDWSTIEGLKNGLIFSGKYECRGFRFTPPHIICFSNREPNVNKLSEDRWIIENIDEPRKISKEEYDIYSVLESSGES